MRSAVARRREGGYTHELEIREHRLIADEPADRGGADKGPTPTELLAASLASCTAITLEMYADRKEWDLGAVEVAVDYDEADKEKPASFKVKIRVPAALSDEQRERLLVIASKCPVHRALSASDNELSDELELIEE
jgi:putative redox protein